MYLTFHITDNNPMTRPNDWDGTWVTGDHALFVIAEKNRRFGEPSVVMRRTQTPKWKAICNRAKHWATKQHIYLFIVNWDLPPFPFWILFSAFHSLHPCASLSNGTSCRIFLLSHKVLFYGNLFIKSTPSCTSTRTLILFSCHPVWTETNTSFCPAVCRICSPSQQYCHVL